MAAKRAKPAVAAVVVVAAAVVAVKASAGKHPVLNVSYVLHFFITW